MSEEIQKELNRAGIIVFCLFFLALCIICSFFKYYVGENIATSLFVGILFSIIAVSPFWAYFETKIENKVRI